MTQSERFANLFTKTSEPSRSVCIFGLIKEREQRSDCPSPPEQPDVEEKAASSEEALMI